MVIIIHHSWCMGGELDTLDYVQHSLTVSWLEKKNVPGISKKG